jgi:hypothetical protein
MSVRWKPVSESVEARDVALARTFAEVSVQLLESPDVNGLLPMICELATTTIPGCDHAAVSLVSGHRLSPAVCDSNVSEGFDQLEREVGEGPSLTAMELHAAVQAADLGEELRWPRLCPRAISELHVRSVLSFVLSRRGLPIGTLTLSSSLPRVLSSPTSAAGAAVFAAHVGVAIAGARDRMNLEQAMASRQLIGQAVGILMAREAVDAEHAFDILRRASQRLNVKLRDVAQQIVEAVPGTARPMDSPLP